MIVRVRTAHGKTLRRRGECRRPVRQDPSREPPTCHLTDVSDKVRAGRGSGCAPRSLPRSTSNCEINRELQELKDRYTDLYEDSPAMYFSLDTQGKVIECNQTMLTSSNWGRLEIIGHSYDKVLHPSKVRRLPGPVPGIHCQRLGRKGNVLGQSSGELIDVWVIGKVVTGSKEIVTHTRFVAQDITVNRLLEAELQEKNRRLGEANVELSQRNQELDEFVYVVSHDLQDRCDLDRVFRFSDERLRRSA